MNECVGPESGIMIINTVLDWHMKSAQEVKFERFMMPYIAVYLDSDYPGKYTARVFDARTPTNIVILNESLDGLQADIKEHTDMTWIPRTAEMDQELIGMWM